MLRDYACECGRPRCRERVYMNIGEYRSASALGRVVTINHSVQMQIITRRRTYAVVKEPVAA